MKIFLDWVIPVYTDFVWFVKWVFMKYRTKLYLFLMGISCSILLLSLALTIHHARRAVLQDIGNLAVSIAQTVAANLDGDLVSPIKTLDDEQTPAYEHVRSYLRKARDVNRSQYAYVKFIYTTHPDPNDPKTFYFGVDAEESEKDRSPAGTVNPDAPIDHLTEHVHEPYTYGRLYNDQWGTWLTGYAPVYDSQGNYVASVGVDISAAFVRQMENRLNFGALIALITCASLAALGASYLSRRATYALQTIEEATLEIGKGNFAVRTNVQTNDEFQHLAQSLNSMCVSLEEKERLKVGFAHFVSRHVMEKILAQGEPHLGGVRKKITVFFCDIRGFTAIAEKLPAEEVVAILNEYFQVMLDIVFKYNGMLDKLIGDAIMAEFGFPVDDENQEKNAVLTAIDMQKALTVLRAKWKNEGKPEIYIGVGIHTGEAVVGTLGSKERLEFTAIGDTVNIAARLEQATRQLNESIIISEETYKAVKSEFNCKPLGPLKLHGKETPINAFAVSTQE